MEPTTIRVEGDQRTISVEDWTLVAASGDTEPRVLDADLGERLGYDRTRKIRDLIKRMIEGGEIADVQQRPTVGRYESRPGIWQERVVEQYWLNEEQALLVTIRSDTAKAMEVRRALVRVFIAARRGLLTPAAPLAAAATVEALVSQQLAEQLAGFKSAILTEIRATLQERAAADTCTIGRVRADQLIKAPLAEIASLRASIGAARRALRREGPRAHAELRADLGFFGEGRTWELLPEALLGRARVKLAEMRRAALRAVSAAANGRQLELVQPPTSLALAPSTVPGA